MDKSFHRSALMLLVGVLLAAAAWAQTPMPPPPAAPTPATAPATAVAATSGAAVTPTTETPAEELLPEQAKSPQTLFEELARFGASLFASVSATGTKPSPAQPISNQPVPPNYLLGPGDRLSLHVWARDFEQVAQDVTVSPEGFLILPEIGRLAVAGQTLEQARAALLAAYSKPFANPTVTLTVAEQRTLEVFVTGDVVRPGKYTLAGMATVLSALYAAGGPAEIGSFRQVSLQRVGQAPVLLDLYDYLLTGRRDQDVVLRPGDTIFVPPVGGEVGLCGEVRRPARYELKGEVTVAAALQLAGGLKPSAYAPMVHLWRQENHAKWRLSALDIAKPESPDLALPLHDGDLLIVKSLLHTGLNTIQLMGAVKRPGYYPCTPETTVSSLLREAEGVLWNAHMGLGVVRRMDDQRHYFVIPFEVKDQLYGDNPPKIALEYKDEVEVFFQDAVEPVKEVQIQGAVAHPGTFPYAGDLKISQLVALAGGLLPEAYLKRADLLRLTADQKYEVVKVDLGAAMRADAKADVALQRGDILKVSKLAEAEPPAEVTVAGYVRNPAKYPRREGMKVSDAIFVAGGLKPGAGPEVLVHRGRFEGEPVTEKLALTGDSGNYQINPDVVLQDDDSVAVLGRGDFQEQVDLVTIQGRVKSPGSYALRRQAGGSYTVYDLLQESGGLLSEANPAGLVVYRKRDFYMGQAQSEDLNRILASVNRETTQAPTQLGTEDQATALAGTVSQNLRQVMSGSGATAIVLPPRPVRPEDWVTAIPVSGRRLLESQGKEGNIELEAGDVVAVPRLVNTVTVLGAVPRSGAVPFMTGKDCLYYLTESGGLREDAATDRMVVIHPNGAAAPISARGTLEPGDVIVVPTKHIVRVVRTESAWNQWARGIISLVIAALAF